MSCSEAGVVELQSVHAFCIGGHYCDGFILLKKVYHTVEQLNVWNKLNVQLNIM